MDKDGATDLLLVGAPMFMSDLKREEGRVYLFSVTKVSNVRKMFGVTFLVTRSLLFTLWRDDYTFFCDLKILSALVGMENWCILRLS